MLMNIVILKNYSTLSKRFLSPFSFTINEDNNNRILILYKYCNIFNHTTSLLFLILYRTIDFCFPQLLKIFCKYFQQIVNIVFYIDNYVHVSNYFHNTITLL